MPRDRHQRKQVEQALQRAEVAGFTVDVLHSGHRWGRVNAPNGQHFTVWSTPKNADVHARRLREFVTRNRKKA